MKVHGTPWKFSKTPANIKRAPNSLDSVQVTFDGVGGGDITTTETTAGVTTSGTTSGGAY